jgi:hypothetical protein
MVGGSSLQIVQRKANTVISYNDKMDAFFVGFANHDIPVIGTIFECRMPDQIKLYLSVDRTNIVLEHNGKDWQLSKMTDLGIVQLVGFGLASVHRKTETTPKEPSYNMVEDLLRNSLKKGK